MFPPVNTSNTGIQHLNNMIDQTTGYLCTYKKISTGKIKGQKLQTWTTSFCNKIALLAQGIRDDIKGTNTVFFIPQSSVPNNKRVTYGLIVCDIKPDKQEQHRTRITIGGNRIFCNYDISTPTVERTPFHLQQHIFPPLEIIQCRKYSSKYPISSSTFVSRDIYNSIASQTLIG